MTRDGFLGLPDDLRLALDTFPFRHSEGLHSPQLGGLEKRFLSDCIDSGFVSSAGEFVERFEAELAFFTGARYAVATSSGTTALHLALIAVGVKPGDLVVLPAITFVATANAVAHCGATPIALDVEQESMGLDPKLLEQFFEEETIAGPAGSRLLRSTHAPIGAVVAVHVLGHPCDILSVSAICERYGVSLVEDAAESLGSYVGATHTGLFGSAGIFSFNGNKTITTGGGGCLVTNDRSLADLVRHLGTTARVPHPFEFDHDAVGYNYRMPNLNAAMGCAQVQRLPEILVRQRKLHDIYASHFFDVGSASIIRQPEGRKSNFWLQAIRLSGSGLAVRDAVLKYGASRKIPLRPLWKPIPRLQAHAHGLHHEIPVAATLHESVVCLPSSPSLLEQTSYSTPKEYCSQ